MIQKIIRFLHCLHAFFFATNTKTIQINLSYDSRYDHLFYLPIYRKKINKRHINIRMTFMNQIVSSN